MMIFFFRNSPQKAAIRCKTLQFTAKRLNSPQNAAHAAKRHKTIHRKTPKFDAKRHNLPQNAAKRRNSMQNAAKCR